MSKLSDANCWVNLAVGDRIKVEAKVISISPDGGVDLGIERNASYELIEKAVTPGQRAYEAFHKSVNAHPWQALEQHVQDRWERTALAVRQS